MPDFKNTRVSTIESWNNYHHTITKRRIEKWLAPDVLALPVADAGGVMAQQAASLRSILEHCFSAFPVERLAIAGSSWSLSDVFDPANVVLDPSALSLVAATRPEWLTDAYRAHAQARDGVPVIVQGGATVGHANAILGKADLALQTSGAADGQRMAGCIATGTHGAALGVGAVHDTVLGVCLMVEPEKMVLLQPSDRWFTPDLAAWLTAMTGIETEDLPDDDLLQAARVAVGGLGIVHSVIVEAVPLYELEGAQIGRTLLDQDVWRAIDTLDTSMLDGRQDPYNFAVMMLPYAKGAQLGAYATTLHKVPRSRPYEGPTHATSMVATDTSRLLSSLIGLVDASMTASLIEHVIVAQSQATYRPGKIGPLFPGQLFGPTTLPPGNGTSTEIAVSQANAVDTLNVLLDTLRAKAADGRHLLGVVGVRFVGPTDALLGMNIHDKTMFVELPSLQSPHMREVHEACWEALEQAKIDYTCHWGQEYGMTAERVRAYYGDDRVDRWAAARQRLLPSEEARIVFNSPMLQRLGLTEVSVAPAGSS